MWSRLTAQQAGNTTFVAALAVTQSFVVNKATLTVTANNQTMAQGNSPAPFTASYSGFVNGDTSAAVTGSPAFSSSAGPGSPLGATPIVVTQGTLASSNYSFTFVNGSVNVVQGTAQTISFTPVPALEYGIGPVTLVASASSGLPGELYRDRTGTRGGLDAECNRRRDHRRDGEPGGDRAIYTAAVPVSQTVAVGSRNSDRDSGKCLASKTMCRTRVFTYALSGLLNGDTSAVVAGAPGEDDDGNAGFAGGNVSDSRYARKPGSGELYLCNRGCRADGDQRRAAAGLLDYLIATGADHAAGAVAAGDADADADQLL